MYNIHYTNYIYYIIRLDGNRMMIQNSMFVPGANKSKQIESWDARWSSMVAAERKIIVLHFKEQVIPTRPWAEASANLWHTLSINKKRK